MHQPNHQTPLDRKKKCCKQNLILLMKEILHPALVGRVNLYNIYICKIMNMSHYVHGSFRARCFAGFLPSTVVSHTKLPHYNSFTGLSLLRNCWLCAGEIFASAKGKLKDFHFILPSNFRIYTPEGPWRLRWNIIMEVLNFGRSWRFWIFVGEPFAVHLPGWFFRNHGTTSQRRR